MKLKKINSTKYQSLNIFINHRHNIHVKYISNISQKIYLFAYLKPDIALLKIKLKDTIVVHSKKETNLLWKKSTSVMYKFMDHQVFSDTKTKILSNTEQSKHIDDKCFPRKKKNIFNSFSIFHYYCRLFTIIFILFVFAFTLSFFFSFAIKAVDQVIYSIDQYILYKIPLELFLKLQKIKQKLKD